MAPFNEAVNVRDGTQSSIRDSPSPRGYAQYEGNFDQTWNIGNVPCGGYSLALVLEACIQHQSKTNHIDPLHISANFIRPTTSQAPFQIRMTVLKSGRGVTNLAADLFQEDLLKITAQAIFGANGPTGKGEFTLLPPSSYARRVPLHVHPSKSTRVPLFPEWQQNGQVAWAFDLQTMARNGRDHPNRTTSETVGGVGGTEWAGWFQFEGPTEKLSNVYLPLLADLFLDPPALFPDDVMPDSEPTWSPTLTLAVDFKFPIRLLEENVRRSKQTVGLYSTSQFYTHPQGRHDVTVEVWSAPTRIGEGVERDGWRDEQICLAVAKQMALSVPMGVNLKNGLRREGSSKL